MNRSLAFPVLVALAVGVSSCGQEFEPPDRAERVARAATEYSPALFDTLRWDSEDVRVDEGNTLYAEECRRCHGSVGLGETDYARERDLDVPSIVDPDWHMASFDALRSMIYRGHESGMPIYGDGDLNPRQIDATAAYILLVLRPEILEEG